MKKCFLLLFSFVAFHMAQGQTLFTYGKNSVTKKEFESAYNKNSSSTPEHKTTLKEYLDLYTNFKLKVQAAKDLHLDTLPALKADLQNFRSQIEESYLKDDKVVKELVDQAFARSQKDIRLEDYFIALPANTDTSLYFKAANDLYHQLSNNQHQDNQSKQVEISPVKTKVGLITVFTLPYSFENIIYSLKPGTYSKPVRVPNGWHIFFNAGEKKSSGEIEIAQILVSAPPGAENERKEAKILADSIYMLLKKGGDFASLAKEYSHDRTSYNNGGILPAFGVGKYETTFEEKAFSIKKNGDILPPFETEYGFHILKRLSANPVPDKKEADFMSQLAQEVSKDSRMELAKEAFTKKIMLSTGLQPSPFDPDILWIITDSAMLANRNISTSNMHENTPLLKFNDKSVERVSDWTQYLRNAQISLTGDTHSHYPALFEQFKEAAALNNYRKRLPTFNAQFKAQLQEFTEGNLLFEVMERNIWGKAAEDTAGLMDYYKKHQKKYLWNESADVMIFTCINAAIAEKVRKDLTNHKSTQTIVLENAGSFQIDSGRYEISQIPIRDKAELIVNKITQPVVNEGDATVVFVKTLALYPAALPRSFEDARGMVISDYQDLLEEKWLIELKKKYPVKVNDTVFESL